ncbi:hypothetical protein BY458DRAFT_572963 [Sporodiniella umbellata]|nr:hypothetical protein BY458DRAFT_572963 [Sporodiniella umbellata]
MDDLFGNVDDLVSPKNKKANQKRTREIKKPRLDINTSLITRKPDKDGFSDMDDSDTEERHRKTPACSDSESVVTEDIQSPAVIIKVASDDFQEKDLENEYYVLNPEDDEASLYNSEYTEESDDNDSGPLVFESKMNAKEQKELKKTEKKYKSRPANRFNPFILFNKDMRAKIKEENPELDNYQLSKLIGKEWRNISPVRKKTHRQQLNDSCRLKRRRTTECLK